ncbi:MAG: hypothetical protein M1837_002396 [Sclerophora amabilis]|nr:MAG: hypothetical protein M1837_002396 [Sclerophora amabilis]
MGGIEEPRRSGRATKGQHTKNNDLPSKASKRGKAKSEKRSKQASAEATPEEEDDGDAIIRCVCGASAEDSDDERMMICCDQCSSWQHNECMEVGEDEDALPEKYLCERCDPESHKGLLEKLAKGEKPWEERAKQKELEEQEKSERKGKRGRKGKGGKKGRPSEVKSEASEDVVEKAPDLDEDISKGDIAVDEGIAEKQSSSVPSDANATTNGARQNANKRKSRGDAENEVEVKSEKETQQPQPKVRRISASASKVAGGHQRRPSTQAPATARRESRELPIQSDITVNIDDIQNSIRKATANAFLRVFAELVSKAVASGSYSVLSSQTPVAVATKLTLDVEHSLFMNHSQQPGDPNQIYRSRARTMMFNLKQNPALCDRLLHGTLTADEFSTMSTDDMASKELQQRTAEMKKVAEKQNFLTQEEGPRIRRTHKGEELVDDDRDFGGATESIFSSAPARRRESGIDSETQKVTSSSVSRTSSVGPSQSEFAEGGSPVSPGNRPLNINTQTSPNASGTKRKSSDAFNIQDVWSSVQSPDADRQRLHQPPTRFSGHTTELERQGPGADPEIDQLLNDDVAESPPYSPTDYDSDPAVVWRGKVMMQGVSDFFASAKHVAGANLADARNIPWPSLMPSILRIDGRIQLERASEYLCNLQHSRTTDVSVVALTPTGGPASQANFDKLWTYFFDRNRYGVIGKVPMALVKDAYIIPVEAGMAKLPLFMTMLEDMTLEELRPKRTVLVVYVVKLPNVSTANKTPDSAGGAGSPLTASQGPDFQTPIPLGHPGSAISPVTGLGATPNVPAFGSPQGQVSLPQQNTHHGFGAASPRSRTEALANQILGPLAESSVVKQLLSQSTEIEATQFGVIKEILEQVPAARSDLNLLSFQLMEKNKAAGR